MQEFTYRKIKDLYKNEINKLQEGQVVSSYDSKLNITFGYALDVIELSRKTKSYLDLSMNTNKNIGRVTMEIYQINIKNGMTLEENKKDLINKISAYELLVHYTFFNDTNMFEIEFSEEMNNLSLKIGKDKLDVYFLISECINKDFLYGKDLDITIQKNNKAEESAENVIAINYSRLYDKAKDILKNKLN